MKNVYLWLAMRTSSKISFVIIFLILGCLFLYQKKETPDSGKTIVCTFSILEDFTQNLLRAIPEVKICTLVNRNQDPHHFHPHPKLFSVIKKASMVVCNGLGFETWFKDCSEHITGVLITASDGIQPLRQVRNPNLFDPHAWNDVGNALIYIKNIRDGLKKVLPEHAERIEANYTDYKKELEMLHIFIKDRFKNLTERTIITTHDAFWYYGKAYSINFIAPQGVSTEEEISAARMAEMVREIRNKKVKALFFENLSNSAAITQLAQETNTKIGGTLYADTLSPVSGPCPTYVDMMRLNTKIIFEALS